MGTSPRWEYSGIKAGWVPPMPEKLKKQLIALLGDAGSRGFISALHTQYHIYVIHEKDSHTHSSGHPSRPEMKAAAAELKRDLEKLIKKTSDEAGGLRPYLDYCLFKGMPDEAGHYRMSHFVKTLEVVRNGCESFLVDQYPSMEKLPKFRSKELFASEVVKLIRTILGEEPQKYIPDDLSVTLPYEDRQGKYARILSACFIAADGFSPGNLKEIAFWGVDFKP